MNENVSALVMLKCIKQNQLRLLRTWSIVVWLIFIRHSSTCRLYNVFRLLWFHQKYQPPPVQARLYFS